MLAIQRVEQGILQKAATVRMAEMNFLERSASRRGRKVSSFGGSVGVQLFEFLSNIRRILQKWLDGNSQLGALGQSSFVLAREILDLWCDLVQFGSTRNIDESVFHVYLSLFEDWVRNARRDLPQSCVSAIEAALQSFREPLQLVTGKSIEKMWTALRPSAPKNLTAYEQYQMLKAIMGRFDKVGTEGMLVCESIVYLITDYLSR